MALTPRSQLPALRLDAARSRAMQVRLMIAHERVLEVRLGQAIAAAVRRAANAQRNGDSIADALASFPAELVRILAPSLTQVARSFGAALITGPKSGHAFLGIEAKAISDVDSAIRRHIETEASRRVVQISEALRDQITRVVEIGIAEGLGVEEIADRIVQSSGGEIGMARARRIARTEVHNAAMYGQQAAAEASPLQYEKIWLATEDHRTRPSHAEAHGQRVALDQPFVLQSERHGRVELMYPGDVNGPPGAVINCRCVALYEPLPLLRDPELPGEPSKPQVPQGSPEPALPDIEIVDPDPAPIDLPTPTPAEPSSPPTSSWWWGWDRIRDYLARLLKSEETP